MILGMSRLLTTLMLTSSMTVMAGATIAPALPKIQEHFAIPIGSPDEIWIKLLLTIPALFTAIGGFLSGVLIDRWGRVMPLAIAVALYGIAGASGLWLDNLGNMLVGRALLGLAVAMITTTSATLIADYFQGPERTRVLGVQAAAMGFGGVVFLLLGGAVAGLNWRYPFLIYLVAFAVLPLVLKLEEPKREPQLRPVHFELPSSNDGPQTLPLGTIALVYVLTTLTMLIFYMVPVQLPFYIKQLGFGGSWEAGLAIALCTLASAMASLTYAKVKANLSFSKVLMCLFFLLASGYGVIANAPSYNIVVLGLLIAGLGVGLVLPNMNVWLNAKTPIALRGKVLGGLTTCIFFGQFCSPLVVQRVVLSSSLQGAYSIAAGVLFLLGLIAATKILIITPNPKARQR
jgi:MFS family permease